MIANAPAMHYVDLLHFTFGDLTVTWCDGADDTIVVLGALPGGGRVSLVGSWALHHPAGVAWQIYGTEGTIRIDTDMHVLGGRAGEPFVDLGIPDAYLLAQELPFPRVTAARSARPTPRCTGGRAPRAGKLIGRAKPGHGWREWVGARSAALAGSRRADVPARAAAQVSVRAVRRYGLGERRQLVGDAPRLAESEDCATRVARPGQERERRDTAFRYYRKSNE